MGHISAYESIRQPMPIFRPKETKHPNRSRAASDKPRPGGRPPVAPLASSTEAPAAPRLRYSVTLVVGVVGLILLVGFLACPGPNSTGGMGLWGGTKGLARTAQTVV